MIADLVYFVSLAAADVVQNWYANDVLDALFLVLSVLLAFTMLYQDYLYILSDICDVDNEDLER